MKKSGFRPLSAIALDIRNNWKNPYFAAVPYLQALATLNDIRDAYGYDDAKSIITYFLANARTWKVDTAKTIKDELRAILKS